MSRFARRNDPVLRWKERVELDEGKIPLRLIAVGAAILIAALAFGSVISNLLTVPSGWQEIEAANPETGIAQQFALNYNIGQAGMSASAELKSVSAVYTAALEDAYRVLTNVEVEHYTNLCTLNHHPNETLTVDETLYSALTKLEQSGSRLLYYAPVWEQYESLFACTNDEEAEKFDPYRSPDVAAFAAEIAKYAADSASVQVQLLGNQQVCLAVSPEYQAYAEENGVESYVDFGMLLNAFLCDAAADALVQQGHTNGFLSSLDGCSRVLAQEEFGLNLFDKGETSLVSLGAAHYQSPASVVVCRSFPAREQEAVNYYTYSDGTDIAPYIGTDALPHSAAVGLVAGSKTDSVAELAIAAYSAFASDSIAENLSGGISYITIQNGQYEIHGDLFQVDQAN